MIREISSSRERVRLALEHQETDRIPIGMVCSGINPPAYDALETYLRRNRGIGVEKYLEPLIDIKGIGPDYTGPSLEERTDYWGVKRRPVSYGSSSYDEIEVYPLGEVETIDDLKNYPWPTTDWFDYSTIPDKIEAVQADRKFAIIAGRGNIFESSWYMRGFEKMFMDVVINPELAGCIMEKVTEFFIAHAKGILEAANGEVDLYFTADDLGGQDGLLMSLKMWEKLIKPYHIRLNKMIHKFGAKVIYHTDGSIMPVVPGLIDMGIDVLEALQFSAKGMNPKVLKDLYGDRLCFCGGISVQTTLPFGTPEDVRQEVQNYIQILGKNGGYILGPSHAIQAGTPPENIVALFNAAANYRFPKHYEREVVKKLIRD